MEGYIIKMREYMIYMKELEERNARLEYENRVFRQENAELKGQLNQTQPQINIKVFLLIKKNIKTFLRISPSRSKSASIIWWINEYKKTLHEKISLSLLYYYLQLKKE